MTQRRPASSSPAPKNPARVRLLKVIVQPLFVYDDTKALIEVAGPPQTVSAVEWPSYAAGSFTEADLQLVLAQVEAQLLAQSSQE